MASVEEPIPPEVELDLARYELRRGGRVERLEKLPMELLTFLAERRGQLVTRAEILARLWGKDVFVDADAAINTAVRKVRRALGDDPDTPRFLETVVGKGYRFVGPITVIVGAEATPSAAIVSRRSVSGRWALGTVALATLIVAVLAGLGRFGPPGGQAMESVAVLPFENTGGDPEAEYLSDGISESLINRLSRLPHLKVIARA
jgi:DNA-binding winged helix-turn-helix (wHTH) protein